MYQMYESDLAFAVFMVTRKPSAVMKEYPVHPIRTLLIREYDRETDTKLQFIRGQQVAEQITKQKAA
jgi:hypothetical protein